MVVTKNSTSISDKHDNKAHTHVHVLNGGYYDNKKTCKVVNLTGSIVQT